MGPHTFRGIYVKLVVDVEKETFFFSGVTAGKAPLFL